MIMTPGASTAGSGSTTLLGEEGGRDKEGVEGSVVVETLEPEPELAQKASPELSPAEGIEREIRSEEGGGRMEGEV